MRSGSVTRLHGGTCGACGLKLIDPTADSCPRCQVLLVTSSSVRRKSRVAAALLAFFFGGFGVHRFYLGEWGLGLLYLLLFWTVVPGVVAFADFTRLIAMSDEQFAAAHGRRDGGGAFVAAVVVILALVLMGVVTALAIPRLVALQSALMGWR